MGAARAGLSGSLHVQVPGSNLTGQTTIKLLAKSWNTQGLLIKELTKAGSATVEVVSSGGRATGDCT